MSKKYKLIKTFPGSLKLGTIEEPIGDIHMMCNCHYGYNISSTPEYWEEVIEKDYEILSVNPTDIHDGYKDKSKIVLWGVCNKDLKYWNIHSVKRLSDGEIFTIGNNVKIIKSTNPCCEQGIITDFSCWLNDINNLEKIKQPLFTTEDNVDIFEGNTYYKVVNETFQLFIMENASKGESLKSKVFSTKKKAEEYILMNKPCLSINDLKSLPLESETLYKRNCRIEKLKELVKTKLQQK